MTSACPVPVPTGTVAGAVPDALGERQVGVSPDQHGAEAAPHGPRSGHLLRARGLRGEHRVVDRADVDVRQLQRRRRTTIGAADDEPDGQPAGGADRHRDAAHLRPGIARDDAHLVRRPAACDHRLRRLERPRLAELAEQRIERCPERQRRRQRALVARDDDPVTDQHQPDGVVARPQVDPQAARLPPDAAASCSPHCPTSTVSVTSAVMPCGERRPTRADEVADRRRGRRLDIVAAAGQRHDAGDHDDQHRTGGQHEPRRRRAPDPPHHRASVARRPRLAARPPPIEATQTAISVPHPRSSANPGR